MAKGLREVAGQIEHRWTALPANVRGAIWILSAAILFTGMATLVKLLGGRLDSFQVAFFRSLTGMIFILPFMMRQGGNAFRTKRIGVHLLRGMSGSTGMMCGFYALVHLPLATANAISFSRAIFLVPLAVLFTGEKIGVRRIAAAVVGFVGVLIILRPSGEMEFAALVAAFGALAVAFAVIFVKLLSRTDGPVTLLFYSSLIGVTVTAVPAIAAWQMPTGVEFVELGAMGAFGVLAHTCFIKAYSVGEVSALAPIDYTRLLFAALVGFFVFGTVPDAWVWVGAALIVASTLYITIREARAGEGSAKPQVRVAAVGTSDAYAEPVVRREETSTQENETGISKRD